MNTINNFWENAKLPLPTIITENGRAITAHHAMLITNVLEVENHSYLEQFDADTSHGDQVLHELGKKLIQHANENKIIADIIFLCSMYFRVCVRARDLTGHTPADDVDRADDRGQDRPARNGRHRPGVGISGAPTAA